MAKARYEKHFPGQQPYKHFLYTSFWRTFMNRDEVLLIKFHDSRRERPWRVPHTAFYDDSLSNTQLRESIEFRSIAYFF